MTRLLHISDPHFGTVQPDVMQALLKLSRDLKPDLLVLSGDITQRAHAEQFRQARAFCDRLAIPHMLTLPGNHDISLLNPFKRFFNPYGAYRREFGQALEPVLDLPDVCVIGVKTTRRWRHKNGEVSTGQVARVAKRLRQASATQLRVVVVHQPLHVLRSEDAHDALRNREAATLAWAAAGADLVLGGHVHLPYAVDLGQCVTGVDRHFWCVQAGTALSSRVRWEAPNSVNVLDFHAGENACSLERWDYRKAVEVPLAEASGLQAQKQAGLFIMAQRTSLALDRRLPG
ncbi:MAG: metallophosphoesterase [Polaromonas sp.]|nr:metallophosphoesterase [Polaromonas sp.]